MLNRSQAIKNVFKKYGNEAIYVTNTGFLSRAVYDLYPNNKNILYMQGSMGLSPAIALGIAKNTTKHVVAFVGDGSLLMHLGITHTIRDENLSNLHVYVIDNNSHESVGSYECAKLEDSYPGIDEIIKTSKDGKLPRVGLSCDQNINQIKALLSE
tara:strand:+ start:9555 stop:10019 length:465 start_codon:yes stop_codon:yes gene_type:complete